jgi:hypothetical protein
MKLQIIFACLSTAILLSNCTPGSDSLISRKRQNYFTTSGSNEAYQNTAILNSTLRDVDPNSNVVQYGHCYSKINSFPTIGDSTSKLGSKIKYGDFQSILTNLEPNTTYHYRSYLQTAGEVIYGEKSDITTGEVSLLGVNNLQNTTTTVIGYISASVTGSITDHGFCWSTTNSAPTVTDSKTSLGAKNDRTNFQSDVTLGANSRHYLRAYFINKNGLAEYSTVFTFTTGN